MICWLSRWKSRTLPRIPGLAGSFRPGGRLADLAPLFDQLRKAELNLKESAHQLEAQFLATGTELEALADHGHRFVQQVEKLVGLASGKDCNSTAFAGAIGLIQQTTDFFAGCQEETVQMLSLLRDYEVQVECLLGVEKELQRAMRPLKVMQTLFKVESAPLGAVVQQMFISLTQEIEGLHTQVQEIFGTKFKQLEQTHRTIGLVIRQLDQQAVTLREVTTVHKSQIESSIETLRKEIATNHERDVRLGTLSKNLSHDVEQIVLGLQFQDIINQKLQHVTAALPQIEAKFVEMKASRGTPPANESTRFLLQSCRLEAGQLQGAEQELAKSESVIQEGVRKILANLSEMDSHCLSLEEFKTLTTSFDGMVQVLLETMEAVRIMLQTTVTSAKAAFEMLRPLGSLASDLTAVVRSMSAQIHLIGLNAQVQAAQAVQGLRGAGLEVLSARTSEISGEANRINEQAATQLDKLVAGLADRVKALGKLQADGLAQQRLFDEQGVREEQQLHALRDEALVTLREIGNSLDKIRVQARATLESVHFGEFHQVTLPALRTPLAAIADVADQWLGEEAHTDTPVNLIDTFRRNYTMASERQVFDQVLARDLTPARGPTAKAADGDIQLFEGQPAETENRAEAPLPEIQMPAAISEPGPEVALAASPGRGDLGANVELF